MILAEGFSIKLLVHLLWLVPLSIFFYYVYKGYKADPRQVPKVSMNQKSASSQHGRKHKKYRQFGLLCLANGLGWAGTAAIGMACIGFIEVLSGGGGNNEFLNPRAVSTVLGVAFLLGVGKTLLD